MKHKTKVTIASIAALIAVGGIAFAAQGYKEHKEIRRAFSPEKIIEKVDLDGDRAASRDEISALTKTHFSSADKNSDGKLSKAEIVAAIDTGSAPKPLKRRSGKIADRLVRQGDINLDGFLALAELENRLGKMHALADWNDDGRVELAEAKRLRGSFGHRRHRNRK